MCQVCNQKRLNEGKEKKVYQLKRTPLKPKKNYQLKRSPVNKVSKKQKAVLEELKEVYNSLKKPGMRCTGCGTDKFLSPSHIIPRSRRPDLTTDPKNITWHCMSMGERRGCHDIWESRDKAQLLDYDQNMAYIKEVDIDYYNLLMMKDRLTGSKNQEE